MLYRDVTLVLASKGENPKYAREIRKKAGRNVIVVKDKLYGEAIKIGVRRARTKYIITMDADGQHRYEDAVALYKARKISKADLLIGHRRQSERSFIRQLGSFFLNSLSSIFASRWVVDLNSGLRIFRRDNALGFESILCDDFSYTTSLAMAHLADGFKVEWFPVNVYSRTEGKSKTQWFKHTLISIGYIVWIGSALRTRKIRAYLRSFRSRSQS